MFLTNVRIGLWRSVIMAMITSALVMSQGYAADAKQKPAEAKQKIYATGGGGKGTHRRLQGRRFQGVACILGSEAKPILFSGDAVVDRESRERFVKSYEEANKLEKAGDSKVVINTGKDAWPFPIPIVKDAAGWKFDTKAGEENPNRGIGRNELSRCRQRLYGCAARAYLRNPQGDKLLHYADKFVSTQVNAMAFTGRERRWRRPHWDLFRQCQGCGICQRRVQGGGGYHGYKYKILKAQGPDAKGGAYDYVAQGRMIGGYALLAWPATYGNSGVMTFLINQDGVIYEKDLGPQTAAQAGKIGKFNPDKSWKQADKK
jgi:hypothetical protein